MLRIAFLMCTVCVILCCLYGVINDDGDDKYRVRRNLCCRYRRRTSNDAAAAVTVPCCRCTRAVGRRRSTSPPPFDSDLRPSIVHPCTEAVAFLPSPASSPVAPPPLPGIVSARRCRVGVRSSFSAHARLACFTSLSLARLLNVDIRTFPPAYIFSRTTMLFAN